MACLVQSKGSYLKFCPLFLRFGDATIAPRLGVRTVKHMKETSAQERVQNPSRKTRVINFSIVVDYDTTKWEDDPFGIEVELSSRLFNPNEECDDIQVLRTSTLSVMDCLT